MAWHPPGSQSRALMAEKTALARELLAQGLTVTQISRQLGCSPAFVRKARAGAPPEPRAERAPS